MAGYHPNRTQKDPTRPGVPPLAWKFLDLLWHLTWIVRKNLGNYFAIGEMIGVAKKNTANVAVFLFLYFGLAAENRFMVVLQLSIFPQTILLLLSLFLVTFLAGGIWIPWQCVVPAT